MVCSKYSKILIIFLLIVFTCSFSLAYVQTTFTNDVYLELIERQIFNQNQFVYLLMFPFYNNSLAWQNDLKPLLDLIHSEQYDIYVLYKKTSSVIEFKVNLFHLNENSGSSKVMYSTVTGNYEVNAHRYDNLLCYLVDYYPSTNSFSVTSTHINTTLPFSAEEIKSDLFIEFNNMVYGGSDVASFNTSILNYLSSIDSINADILDELSNLSSSLSSIDSNTSVNYSQGISQISTKISDLLEDNEEIISQNSDMIQEQQEINSNLEQLNDTLTDDTITSSSSDLPSDNVQDITQSGIDGIFTSIYNAFCTGQAQDIIFPIPFTNKNITLSPYYVRDMLSNNGASWVYNLIQAFWGYLIGRYIVKDISRKITKIKSGDIENIENNNIKEDML